MTQLNNSYTLFDDEGVNEANTYGEGWKGNEFLSFLSTSNDDKDIFLESLYLLVTLPPTADPAVGDYIVNGTLVTAWIWDAVDTSSASLGSLVLQGDGFTVGTDIFNTTDIYYIFRDELYGDLRSCEVEGEFPDLLVCGDVLNSISYSGRHLADIGGPNREYYNLPPFMTFVENITIDQGERSYEIDVVLSRSAGSVWDESKQVTFVSVEDVTNSLFFLEPPTMITNQTIAFKVRASRTGVANVTLTISDDGGSVSPGSNSTTYILFITILRVPQLAAFDLPVGAGFEFSNAIVLPATSSGISSFIQNVSIPNITLVVSAADPSFFTSGPELVYRNNSGNEVWDLEFELDPYKRGIVQLNVGLFSNIGDLNGTAVIYFEACGYRSVVREGDRKEICVRESATQDIFTRRSVVREDVQGEFQPGS